MCFIYLLKKINIKIYDLIRYIDISIYWTFQSIQLLDLIIWKNVARWTTGLNIKFNINWINILSNRY